MHAGAVLAAGGVLALYAVGFLLLTIVYALTGPPLAQDSVRKRGVESRVQYFQTFQTGEAVIVPEQSMSSESNAVREILRPIRLFSRLRFRELLRVFKDTVIEWSNDKAPRLGASLAFYTLLSLAPLLIVIVAVAALVYGEKAAQGQLVWEIQDLVGLEGARAIQGLIESAYKPGAGVIATLLGLLTLAFGASSVIVELRDALNTIWHVPLPSGGPGIASIFRMLKQRFYSFAMILAIGFLLLVSLVLNAWIAAMGNVFGALLPAPEAVLHSATFLFSFLMITFLFAAIYKIVPDVRLAWSDVVIGAAVSSLCFTCGKQLIALYLAKASFHSAYGAAGSLVVVLVWVYYSAQLFFLGAEFTKVYTKTLQAHANSFKILKRDQSYSVIMDPSTERWVKGRK